VLHYNYLFPLHPLYHKYAKLVILNIQQLHHYAKQPVNDIGQHPHHPWHPLYAQRTQWPNVGSLFQGIWPRQSIGLLRPHQPTIAIEIAAQFRLSRSTTQAPP